MAQQKLISMLPAELQNDFDCLIDECHYSEDERRIVKQADVLCAYLKCLEELSAGNNEFSQAKARLEKMLTALKNPAMDYFMEIFIPSFSISFDEMYHEEHAVN